MPQEQVTIRDDRGNTVGRVDFLWDDVRVIGEADGALKYQEPSDLYREKRREDLLRSLGFQVIRWGWSDLARPRDLFERLWKAVGHSDRPRQPVPEYVSRRSTSSFVQGLDMTRRRAAS
jgi:very-short-patch-repair endonuclease